MSKKCAKCEKTVYPIEELKCLDKVWHKGCFKCNECGMTLNMKNYKGYNKMPYCNAHYPQTKFTSVAETPEMARLAQNTKIQSNIHYQQRHQQEKGKYTQVADDPEMMRLLKAQRQQSDIKYHEDFERNIKGTKIQVADDPETARIRKNMATVSQVEYKGLRKQHDDMEARRTNISKDGVQHRQPPPQHVRPVSQEDVASPYSARNTGASTVYTHSGKVEMQGGGRHVGSIHDYDPLNNQFGSIGQGYSAPGSGQWAETVQMPSGYGASQQRVPPPQAYQPPPAEQHRYNPPAPAAPQPAAPPPTATGFRCKAMYDYEAGDDDEVGFRDGDTIIDCEPIDDGWMFGTVQRTGQRGMLPANYVERL